MSTSTWIHSSRDHLLNYFVQSTTNVRKLPVCFGSFEKRVKSYEAELQGINRDLLSIEEADYLEDRGTTLERQLFDLIKCQH